MDYIYQELLRQRAALARLLLGGGKERKELRMSTGAAERPTDRLEESGAWENARYGLLQAAWPAGGGAVFTEELTGGAPLPWEEISEVPETVYRPLMVRMPARIG